LKTLETEPRHVSFFVVLGPDFNIYQPSNGCTNKSSLPVLVWIPGGSFISGSSTAAGLDGSVLASNEEIIVITLQYRLGVLGFFQTTSTVDEANGGGPGMSTVAGNQATRDVVQALTFLHKVIASFGGDPGKVTLAGQSSGAHMIRALLTTPSASSLFARAIMQSDPTDYGVSSPAVADWLGDQTLSKLNCTDVACLRAASVGDIVSVQNDLYNSAASENPAVAMGEPWRPVYGTYVTGELEYTESTQGKSVLLTSVANDGGPAIASATSNQDVPLSAFDAYAGALLGSARVNGSAQVLETVVDAYEPPANSTDADAATEALEAMVTDGTFRCGTQMLARDLVAKAGNGKVYLGQFVLGVQYPTNTQWDYCDVAGRVVSLFVICMCVRVF
jgi:carboxylesterase type B